MKSSTNSEVHTKKKLVGDSGYECNYCIAKNHLARDCMLKKIIENKEKVKDEAYYVQMWQTKNLFRYYNPFLLIKYSIL